MGGSNFNSQSGSKNPSSHRMTVFNEGKDHINKNDLLITLLEKDHILSKYNIPKTQIQNELHAISEDHLSMNNIIDLLKKWNIAKADEDILIKDLSAYTRKKHIK